MLVLKNINYYFYYLLGHEYVYMNKCRVFPIEIWEGASVRIGANVSVGIKIVMG